MVYCQQCNKFNKEATEVGNEWICEDCRHENEEQKKSQSESTRTNPQHGN